MYTCFRYNFPSNGNAQEDIRIAPHNTVTSEREQVQSRLIVAPVQDAEIRERGVVRVDRKDPRAY